uniref:T9SS type A sorting domain-containing protein n=1 Tax=candidate division WOR-3 bacterium TaxID=2052148 RepID=A0A7C4GCR9_UNCW3
MKFNVVLIASVCVVASALGTEPGFDPKEVVRQVRRPERRQASGGEREAPDHGEFLIDTSSTPAPAPYGQWEPSIAFDGTNYLVVWKDYRSGDDYDIYGARVTPQGTVLDPQGFAVSQAAGYEWYPDLRFDGTNYLVVWEDYRRGSDTSLIYGARVTPQGTVLDPQGFAISPAANDQKLPGLGFDGTNYLAVWSDGRSGSESDIYGARVTPQGTVLDPQGFLVSQGVNDQESPALGFDGANYLAVWSDGRSGSGSDIYGARVTPQGTVLDPAGFAISRASGYQRSPDLRFDGTNFLVVWEDYRGGSRDTSDIYGARVTPQGTVLDPQGFAISQAAGYQWSPALAFDGANYLVVWEDCWRSGNHDIDIYGARVTPQGTVLDPAGFVVSQASGNQEFAALAFDGANYLAVWSDGRSGSSDIYGARITPQGTVLDTQGFVISRAADYQWYPALAFHGANYLVVWMDSRHGSDYDIYGARVRPDGAVFDEGAVVRQEGSQWYPALAHGTGSEVFLVYQGWAGTVGGKTYNTDRIWGKLNPAPGVEEAMNAERGTRNVGASVVRGVINCQLPVSGLQSATVLLDAAGRKVMELRAGPNDVRHLSPGVYFVRQASGVVKVVVQR